MQKWLQAGYVYQNQLLPSHARTLQGGIISPVLANMTLDGLEAMLAKRFPNAKWTARKMRVVRYADDFWFQKLKYILWRERDQFNFYDSKKLGAYRVTPKNSVEHVHPQNEEFGRLMDVKYLDRFGNLD